MAKLDSQGNLTLSRSEVAELRHAVFQYGQLQREGKYDQAAGMMKQIRCRIPIDPAKTEEDNA